jgi:hypothetical protein
MKEATRRRLMASVRVGLLIIEELRLAQREGRPCPDREEMRKTAKEAAGALRDLVWNYYHVE